MTSFEVVVLDEDGGVRTVATASTRQVAEQIARAARRALSGAGVYIAEYSTECPYVKQTEVLS